MEMLAHPVTLLFLTVTVYGLANLVRARTGSILCNPVMISTCLIILYLPFVFNRYGFKVTSSLRTTKRPA